MKENDFEKIIVKYPELIEAELKLLDRQIIIYNRRIDLLFQDKFNRKLLIELKIGPIKDEHIGQILSYEGLILSHDDPTVRVMLIGNRVPPNIQRSLDHHGIAWKEISFSYLRDFIMQKDDKDFLPLFNEYGTHSSNEEIKTRTKTSNQILMNQNTFNKPKPALLILTEKKWINIALEHFKTINRCDFRSNATIGSAISLNIQSVYFKLKDVKGEQGEIRISYKADLIEITTENKKEYRPEGYENLTGKYYYGFHNLRLLKNPCLLSDLKHYKSGQNLRIDLPRACIILDPEIE